MSTKNLLTVALVAAAVSGVAVYACIQKRKRAKRKNLSVNFI